MILAVLLLALGLGLIVAEVLFPSFGVLSVLAAAAIVGAIVVAFQESSTLGFQFLGTTMVLLPLTVLLGFKVFPKSPVGKHMVSAGLSFESEAATDPRDLELVGVEGTAESDCRPAGVARLSGRRVDVVTRGEWIESGQPVVVVAVKGNRVVVSARAAQEVEADPDGIDDPESEEVG